MIFLLSRLGLLGAIGVAAFYAFQFGADHTPVSLQIAAPYYTIAENAAKDAVMFTIAVSVIGAAGSIIFLFANGNRLARSRAVYIDGFEIFVQGLVFVAAAFGCGALIKPHLPTSFNWSQWPAYAWEQWAAIAVVAIVVMAALLLIVLIVRRAVRALDEDMFREGSTELNDAKKEVSRVGDETKKGLGVLQDSMAILFQEFGWTFADGKWSGPNANNKFNRKLIHLLEATGHTFDEADQVWVAPEKSLYSLLSDIQTDLNVTGEDMGWTTDGNDKWTKPAKSVYVLLSEIAAAGTGIQNIEQLDARLTEMQKLLGHVAAKVGVPASDVGPFKLAS
jgi:hypothetical protein